jgi:hypothetical protein
MIIIANAMNYRILQPLAASVLTGSKIPEDRAMEQKALTRWGCRQALDVRSWKVAAPTELEFKLSVRHQNRIG